jgi:hypothetical protein
MIAALKPWRSRSLKYFGAAMNSLHPVVVRYVEYYAQYDAAPELTGAILARGTVQDDSEANAILDVIDAMYARLNADVRSGVVVYRQAIHAYDADKVAETIVSWLEKSGYDRVTRSRGY